MNGGRVDRKTLQTCRYWSRALPAYPVTVSQLCRLEPGTWDGEYHNAYGYLAMQDFLGTEPRRMAPVPVLFAYGRKHRHPGLSCKGADETGYESKYAPYLAAAGEHLAYAIAALTVRERRTCPVS